MMEQPLRVIQKEFIYGIDGKEVGAVLSVVELGGKVPLSIAQVPYDEEIIAALEKEYNAKFYKQEEILTLWQE